MSKGEILENLEAGRYRVQVQFSMELRDAWVARLEQRNTFIEERLTTLATDQANAEAEVNAAITAMNALLAAPNPDFKTQTEQVAAAIGVIREKTAILQGILRTIKELELQEGINDDKIRQLGLIQSDKEVNAWCADLSEDIRVGHTVPLVIVPGDPNENHYQIYPQSRPTSSDDLVNYSEALHGLTIPARTVTPSTFFYNLAMRAPWQTFQPLYRYGTITEIHSNGKVDVELDEVTVESAGQERIDITPRLVETSGQRQTLEQVNVVYMECGSSAFTVGDEVVVHFTEQTIASAEVIGFKRYPKACQLITVYASLIDDSNVISDTNELRVTEDGWTVVPDSEGETRKAYWIGETLALSWEGPQARHAWTNDWSSPFGMTTDRVHDTSPTPFLYSRGLLLATAPAPIIGACLHRDSDKLIVVCWSEDDNHVVYSAPRLDPTTWTEIGSYTNNPDGSFPFSSHYGEENWFFHPNGDKAVSVRYRGRQNQYWTTGAGEDPIAYAHLWTLTINNDGGELTCSFEATAQYTTVAEDTASSFNDCTPAYGFGGISCSISSTGVQRWTRPIIWAEYDENYSLVTCGDELAGSGGSAEAYGEELTGCDVIPLDAEDGAEIPVTATQSQDYVIYHRITGTFDYYEYHESYSSSGSFEQSVCTTTPPPLFPECVPMTEGGSSSSWNINFNYLAHVNLGAASPVLVTRSGTMLKSQATTLRAPVVSSHESCQPFYNTNDTTATITWQLQVDVDGTQTSVGTESFTANYAVLSEALEYAVRIGQTLGGVSRPTTYLTNQIPMRSTTVVTPDGTHVITADRDIGDGRVYVSPDADDLFDGDLEQQAKVGVG